jgi:hypothetical protein
MREIVMQFFEGEGIHVDEAEGVVMRVTIPAESARYDCLLRADNETGVLVFYTHCPVQVPAERMHAALELVARLNFDHTLGNLEIDVETGRMRFKTSIDVEGETLTEGLIANLVYANVASLEQMLPAITSVVLKQQTPSDALQALFA